MIFKKLINSVYYDEVWVVLVKEYKLKDGAYEVYKSVFEELKILRPKPCKPPITLVSFIDYLVTYLSIRIFPPKIKSIFTLFFPVIIQ